jgi:hypothetical protein
MDTKGSRDLLNIELAAEKLLSEIICNVKQNIRMTDKETTLSLSFKSRGL